MTLRRVGGRLFWLRLRSRSDSAKTSGPTATRGSSYTARPLPLPRLPCTPSAIIDPTLWARVHEILQKAPQARDAATGRARSAALLRGLLFTADGEAYYPTYTSRQGKQFHYYVTRSQSVGDQQAASRQRLPAQTVETATVAQIKRVLASPEAIAAVCQKLEHPGSPMGEAEAVVALQGLGHVWDQLFPAEQHRLAQLMIERIEWNAAGLKIRWRPLGWRELLGEFAPDRMGLDLVVMEAAT